jgi:hypothetical protein
VSSSRASSATRDAGTWVPKLKGGSEFWDEDPYARADAD